VDGHKREDVVKYRQIVFLPMMEKLQSYARQYDKMPGGKWEIVEPLLPLSIQRHVFYYYDESCFHGYDYKKTLWLDSITEQQKMLGKSKGTIIYILDFIRLKGRINILELNLNTRKIIYLSARGDP
jgi:hypothetical protein